MHEVPIGRRPAVTFPARRPVPLVVEVLQHQEVRGGVAHGCRFVGLAERDRDAMVTYVLEQERHFIAKRRDSLHTGHRALASHDSGTVCPVRAVEP